MEAAAHAVLVLLYAASTASTAGLVWISCGKLALAMTGAMIMCGIGGTVACAHVVCDASPARSVRQCAALAGGALLFGWGGIAHATAAGTSRVGVPPPPASLRIGCHAWEYEGLTLVARLGVMWALCAWELFVTAVCTLALATRSNRVGYATSA